MIRADTASIIRVTIIRGGSDLKRWVPFLRPPRNNARPKTSREFPRIEPTNAACTTLCETGTQRKYSRQIAQADFRVRTAVFPWLPDQADSQAVLLRRRLSSPSRASAAAAAANVTTGDCSCIMKRSGEHGGDCREADYDLFLFLHLSLF